MVQIKKKAIFTVNYFMKNFLLFLFFVVSLSVSSQVDSTKRTNPKDSLAEDSLKKTTVRPDSLNQIKEAPLKTDSSETKTAKDSVPVLPHSSGIAAPKDTSKINPAVKEPVAAPPAPKTENPVLPPAPQDTVKAPVYVNDTLRKKFRYGNDTLKYAMLDSLTAEELLLYYLNEPAPPQLIKGGTVGDSLYYVLNPLTIPTETVQGESLSREYTEGPVEMDSLVQAEQQLRPKISLGAGRL